MHAAWTNFSSFIWCTVACGLRHRCWNRRCSAELTRKNYVRCYKRQKFIYNTKVSTFGKMKIVDGNTEYWALFPRSFAVQRKIVSILQCRKWFVGVHCIVWWTGVICSDRFVIIQLHCIYRVRIVSRYWRQIVRIFRESYYIISSANCSTFSTHISMKYLCMARESLYSCTVCPKLTDSTKRTVESI